VIELTYEAGMLTNLSALSVVDVALSPQITPHYS